MSLTTANKKDNNTHSQTYAMAAASMCLHKGENKQKNRGETDAGEANNVRSAKSCSSVRDKRARRKTLD